MTEPKVLKPRDPAHVHFGGYAKLPLNELSVVAPKGVVRNWTDEFAPETIEKDIPYNRSVKPYRGYRPTSRWGVVSKDMVKGDSVLTPSLADAKRLQQALINRYKRATYGRTIGKGLTARKITKCREWRDGNREGYRVWLMKDIPDQ